MMEKALPGVAGGDVARIRSEYRIRGLTPQVISHFRDVVCSHYWSQGRDLPWRKTNDPYHILVSEFMLQQTRVERVQHYYPRFLERFPDFSALASATLSEVLQEWKGLGYNRRALALRDTARRVCGGYDGILPSEEPILRSLPGIGRATAAAICAFAFNQPAMLLETNIRTVFIYCFFWDRQGVKDSDILPLLKDTIPLRSAREWYYALMDYGVSVKKREGNLTRQTHSYRSQPRFVDSDRQIRGRILTQLMLHSRQREEEIQEGLGIPTLRIHRLLTTLKREGFLRREGESWLLMH
ncbi:MAG: A/G-specific adenine glycosylase [Methanomicrobiales archaeon]|nr:A/G-specific adenine glycosylase [Methanomicrobiales archaeon]